MTLHNDVLVPKCGQVYDNHFVQCHFFNLHTLNVIISGVFSGMQCTIITFSSYLQLILRISAYKKKH